jgi:hypothetical protein
MPSEYSVKMTAALEVCTKDMQCAIVISLVSEGMKGGEVYQKFAARYSKNCVPQ